MNTVFEIGGKEREEGGGSRRSEPQNVPLIYIV